MFIPFNRLIFSQQSHTPRIQWYGNMSFHRVNTWFHISKNFSVKQSTDYSTITRPLTRLQNHQPYWRIFVPTSQACIVLKSLSILTWDVSLIQPSCYRLWIVITQVVLHWPVPTHSGETNFLHCLKKSQP